MALDYTRTSDLIEEILRRSEAKNHIDARHCMEAVIANINLLSFDSLIKYIDIESNRLEESKKLDLMVDDFDCNVAFDWDIFDICQLHIAPVVCHTYSITDPILVFKN